MGISRVYLDSYYLVELVKEGGEASDVRSLLYRLADSNAFNIFVSQVALGEVFTVVCRDCKPGGPCPRDMASKLTDVMESNRIGWECAVPVEGTAFGIMRDLREADTMLDPTDTMLDPTDTMIVSHALADRYSKFFFTNDGSLLGNREIIKLEKRLREDGMRETDLKIQDGFTGRTM